jgi:hypothetical protein
MLGENQETALVKVDSLPAVAGILPDVEGIKDIFARYQEFQKQLRAILGPQDFIYVVKRRDGGKPETFLSRESAEQLTGAYRKSGQDVVVAEEIVKSGLYRLRMMFGIYLLPEGERKVKEELLPAKNDRGEDMQILRRTEECDAYRRITIFKDSAGRNAYSCEVQLFGQMGKFHVYGDGSCNRAEKGKEDVNSHTIVSTAWTRAMKRLVEDATGVPMAMDAGETGSEFSTGSPMSEVKATVETPEGVTVRDVVIESPIQTETPSESAEVQKRGRGRPRKAEAPPKSPSVSAPEPTERQKLIAKMRSAITEIGKKKKIQSTAEQVEEALCGTKDRDKKKFEELTDDQLAVIYAEEIEPRIETGVKA